MAAFSEYEAYDALGLAALARRPQVTPTELLNAAQATLFRRARLLEAARPWRGRRPALAS